MSDTYKHFEPVTWIEVTDKSKWYFHAPYHNLHGIYHSYIFHDSHQYNRHQEGNYSLEVRDNKTFMILDDIRYLVVSICNYNTFELISSDGSVYKKFNKSIS